MLIKAWGFCPECCKRATDAREKAKSELEASYGTAEPAAFVARWAAVEAMKLPADRTLDLDIGLRLTGTAPSEPAGAEFAESAANVRGVAGLFVRAEATCRACTYSASVETRLGMREEVR